MKIAPFGHHNKKDEDGSPSVAGRCRRLLRDGASHKINTVPVCVLLILLMIYSFSLYRASVTAHRIWEAVRPRRTWGDSCKGPLVIPHNDTGDPILHVCMTGDGRWPGPIGARSKSSARAKSSDEPSCNVLSFGINYDFTIDNYFLRRHNCRVWSFDPSMDMEDPAGNNWQQGPHHRFIRAGIGVEDGEIVGRSERDTFVRNRDGSGKRSSYTIKSLETIMREMEVDYVDVVRLDTEGAEWEVLKAWQRLNLIGSIGQLIMEIHVLTGKSGELAQFEKLLCQNDTSPVDQSQCFLQMPYATPNFYGGFLHTYEVTMIH